MNRNQPGAANVRRWKNGGALVSLMLAVMISTPAAGLSGLAPEPVVLPDGYSETLRLADEAWAPSPTTVAGAMQALVDGMGLTVEPYAGPLPTTLAAAATAYAASVGIETLPTEPVPTLPPALDLALARLVGLMTVAGSGDPATMAWAAELADAVEAQDWERVTAMTEAHPDVLASAIALAPAALAIGAAVDDVIDVISSDAFAASISVQFSDFIDVLGVVHLYDLREFITGGFANTNHAGTAAPITIDFAGSDTYPAGFGCNSVLIDADGSETYTGAACAQGGGAGGVGVLADLDLGPLPDDDTYLAAAIAQGSGFGGFGVLVDAAGQDNALCVVWCQGSGVVGGGAFVRGTGSDFIVAATGAQGFGSTGAGLLAGGLNDDTYFMPGLGAPLVVGQGAGIRSNQLASGAGALVDPAGSDRYILYSIGINDASHQAWGQGYADLLGGGALVDTGGIHDALVLAAAGIDIAGGDMRSEARGQGAGAREGQGVLALVDTSGSNDVYASSFAATLSVTTGQAGDAHSRTLAQGAGDEGGRGALVGGLGSDSYSLRADATTTAVNSDSAESFGVAFQFAQDLCQQSSYAFGSSFAYAYSSCSAYQISAVQAYAWSQASAGATAGDAVAEAHGQGYGYENGFGGLVDLAGNDRYDLNAVAVPTALAYATSVAYAYALDYQYATAYNNALGYATGSQYSYEYDGYGIAAGSAYALASSVSFAVARADATARATAMSSAEASAGDAIADAHGQGYGSVNGVGALVDAIGQDRFALEGVASPMALSLAISAASAGASAYAYSNALSFSQAYASHFSYSFVYGNGSSIVTDTDYDEDILECEGTAGAPLDVFFVLDDSGSMFSGTGEPGVTKLQAARDGSISLLNSLGPADHSGVARFASTAQTLKGLDNNHAGTISAIQNQYGLGGGTNLGAGLNQAISAYQGHAFHGSRQVVLFLTDGYGSGGPAEATTLKNMGIEVFSIGLGSSIDTVKLEGIASEPKSEHYFNPQTTQELRDLFAQLTGTLVSACDAVASATSSAIANVFGRSISQAISNAVARSSSNAFSQAFAEAEALAAAASATASSVGATLATSHGQGYGSLNGAGLFARGDPECMEIERATLPTPGTIHLPGGGIVVKPDTDAVQVGLAKIHDVATDTCAERPCAEPPTTPVVPPVTPPGIPVAPPVGTPDTIAIDRIADLAEVAIKIDDAPLGAGASNHCGLSGGDAVSMHAAARPVGYAISGSQALAFADATATATSAAVSSARAFSDAIAQGYTVKYAIAQAYAEAKASCSIHVEGGDEAACTAMATALAYALAQAVAQSVSVADAVADAYAYAYSQALAQARAKEGAAASSSSAVSFGTIEALAEGQGRGSTNGAGAIVGGMGNDATKLGATAAASGTATSISSSNAACASSAAVSMSGVSAEALGQAHATTAALGVSLDLAGDDAYAMGASASSGVTANSIASCPGWAEATAVSTGTIASLAQGRVHSDGRSVAAFVDLDGNDSFTGGSGGPLADADIVWVRVFADL